MCLADLIQRRGLLAAIIVASWLGVGGPRAGVLPAAEPAAPEANASAAKKPPRYPHVTVATWYEVDPHWPQRPLDKPWGQMPGIAVDCRDQVWIFTRANPTVHVYDGQGKFQRAWGEEVVGPAFQKLVAHHVKLDSQGMVWLADVGNHVIWQVSPTGKVLKTTLRKMV